MLEGVVLEFEKDALNEIVRIAIEKIRARSLRSVMEDYLMDIMYKLPDMEGVKKVLVTAETIKRRKDPEFKMIKNRKTA